jgi:hypothetical protein
MNRLELKNLLIRKSKSLLILSLIFISFKSFSDTTSESEGINYYTATDMWLAMEDRINDDFDLNDVAIYLKIHAFSNNCNSSDVCDIQEMVVVATPMVAGALDDLTLQFNPFLTAGFPMPKYKIIEHQNSAITSTISSTSTPFTKLYKGVSDMFVGSSCSNMVNIYSPSCQGNSRVFTFVFGDRCGPSCAPSSHPQIKISSTDTIEQTFAEFFHLENCSQGYGNSYKCIKLDGTPCVPSGTVGTTGNGMLGAGSMVAIMGSGSAILPAERVSLDTAFDLEALIDADPLTVHCDIQGGAWDPAVCEPEIKESINTSAYLSASTIDLDPLSSTYFNRPAVQYAFLAPDPTFGGSDLFNEVDHFTIHTSRTHCNIVDCVSGDGPQFSSGGSPTPGGSICGP